MKDINDILFWHRVKLEDGMVTNGGSDVANHDWNQFKEIDFVGKSVLDVGCWDGYFSFEAERRGASRVVSLDDPKYRWGGMDGYNFLHEYYGSKAEFVKGSVYELGDIFNGAVFDVVLCYGVLYHLSDPLVAMNIIYKICKGVAVFEGLYDMDDRKYLRLLDVGSLGGDNSNFYVMSSGYAEYISKLNGFQVVKWKHYSDRSSYMSNRVGERSRNFYPYM